MRKILNIIFFNTILLAPILSTGATAFKSGETTTGMTKTCYYDYLGSAYTKTVSNIQLCPLSITVSAPGSRSSNSNTYNGQARQSTSGGTAFKKGERDAGLNKICYYDYLGSEYTKTVSSISLCPLSIRVK